MMGQSLTNVRAVEKDMRLPLAVRRLRIDHYFSQIDQLLAQILFEAVLCGLGN